MTGISLTHTLGEWDGTFAIVLEAMMRDLLADGVPLRDVTLTYENDGGQVEIIEGDVVAVDSRAVTFADGRAAPVEATIGVLVS